MVEELRKEKECLRVKDERENFGEGKYNKVRKIVWDLLEKPQTSKTANVRIQHYHTYENDVKLCSAD